MTAKVGSQNKPFIIEENEQGCWITSSHKYDASGYLRLFIGDKYYNLHRKVYETFYKIHLSNKDIIRHTCDNRRCFNPDHLVAGTQQDNMNDMVIRGRSLKGSRHPKNKLSEEAVLFIFNSNKKHKELAEQFGVVKGCIGNIKSGVTWSWLTNTTR